MTLIGLTTLQQLTVLVPIGLFLGIVLALGRLYHESEMTAMAACGVGPLSVYRPIVLLTLLVVALLAVLSLRIVPAASSSMLVSVAAFASLSFSARALFCWRSASADSARRAADLAASSSLALPAASSMMSS
jgi:lipopolysaccharide export LptBFGC system permease protein LptF